MTRITWQRGNRPKHFTADLENGGAEIYWRPAGTEGQAGWFLEIRCGETSTLHSANSQQEAADRANEVWPRIQEQERLRKARADDEDEIVAMLEAALRLGRVDIEPFGIEGSASERLLRISGHIVRLKALAGPLQPLAAAVSAELYRRRLSISAGKSTENGR